MRYNKKIAAALASFLLISVPCSASSSSNEILSAALALMSAQKSGGTPSSKLQSLLNIAMMSNGGFEIGNGIKYSWMDSGDTKSFVQCSLSTTKPEIDKAVDAVCSIMLFDKKYSATPSPLQFSQTFSSPGKNSMTGAFYIYQTAKEMDDGQLVEINGQQAGTTFVTINIDNVRDSTTALGKENERKTVNPTDPISGEPIQGTQGVAPTIIPEVDNNQYYEGSIPYLKDDGTNTDPLPKPTDGGTKTPDGYGDDPDALNGGGLPTIDPLNNNSSIDDSPLNNSNNIADYLNRALDDSGAFDVGGDDWSNSGKGNDGEASLDDYFGGISAEDADAPGGLTDDLLGLGTSIYDDEPTETEQTIVAEGSDGEPQEVFVVAEESAKDEPQAQSEASEFENLANLYQQGLAGLDGPSRNNGDNSNSGLLGSMTAQDGSSLGRRLQRLAGGDASFSNNPSVTASDQELFELAKKELTGAGVSLEDIKKGLTYSPNSAWTDPVIAWDFNRITTLMKKRKISLQPNNR